MSELPEHEVLFENEDLQVTVSETAGADGPVVTVRAKGGKYNAAIHIEPTFGLTKKDRGLWITSVPDTQTKTHDEYFLARSGGNDESWPAIHVAIRRKLPHIAHDILP